MRVPVGVIVALLVAIAAPASAERSPKQVKRALGEAVDQSFQRTLPDEPEPGATDAKDRKRPQYRPAAPRPRREPVARGDSAMSAIASWVLWALVIVAALVIAFWMVQELGDAPDRGELDADGDDEQDGDGAHDAVVKRPLGDAEQLAAGGDYGAAIHALLLRTLEELTRRAQVHIPESLTSREILGRVALPHEARVALEGLVLAVEITHFGGAEPGADEYAMCRDHFRKFASAYTRGMAA